MSASDSRAVSLTVVTHNALPSLRRCLESIERHTRGVAYRLIVVNNGSRDGTEGFLRRYARRRRLHFLNHSSNKGKAAALNEAVARFPAAWHAFLDDDAAASPGWLARLLGAALEAGPTTDIVGCRSVYPDGRICGAEMFLWRAQHGREEPDLGQRNYVRYCDGVAGTCMLVRGELFQRTNFRESLRQQYEDADFCLTARKRGSRILYRGDIAVRHEKLLRADESALSRNYARMSRVWGSPVFPDSLALDRHYALAWDDLWHQRWEKLARGCRLLLAVDPAPTYAYWWRAIALSRAGRHRQALGVYDRALAVGYLPRALRTRLELARELELRLIRRA